MQPTETWTQPWNSRARFIGRWPEKPSNSKKPWAVMLSAVRNSARRGIWPGPEGHVDERELLEDLILHGLGPAAADSDDPGGILGLEPLGLPEPAEKAVVGGLADRAGVEEDHVGVVLLLGLGVAERFEHALHALGVVLVHLAAEGGEVVALHRRFKIRGLRLRFLRWTIPPQSRPRPRRRTRRTRDTGTQLGAGRPGSHS